MPSTLVPTGTRSLSSLDPLWVRLASSLAAATRVPTNPCCARLMGHRIVLYSQFSTGNRCIAGHLGRPHGWTRLRFCRFSRPLLHQHDTVRRRLAQILCKSGVQAYTSMLGERFVCLCNTASPAPLGATGPPWRPHAQIHAGRCAESGSGRHLPSVCAKPGPERVSAACALMASQTEDIVPTT